MITRFFCILLDFGGHLTRRWASGKNGVGSGLRPMNFSRSCHRHSEVFSFTNFRSCCFCLAFSERVILFGFYHFFLFFTLKEILCRYTFMSLNLTIFEQQNLDTVEEVLILTTSDI